MIQIAWNVQNRQIRDRRWISGCQSRGAVGSAGKGKGSVTANGQGFFKDGQLHNFVNILKTEKHTL